MDKVKELRKVLKGNRSAYYVGGTLCIDDGDTPVFFNIQDQNNTPEEAYLIAHIYVQNKTPRHSFWNTAQRIIEVYSKDQKACSVDNLFVLECPACDRMFGVVHFEHVRCCPYCRCRVAGIY
jgi:hypothetical protein